MDHYLTEHFTKEEMQCHCGCGKCDMNLDFMDKLETLRVMYGQPIIISSGYRCPVHNNNISSTGSKGPHTTGKAVDIKVYGTDAYNLLKFAFHYGFTGIGIMQKGPRDGRFIHLDTVDSEKAPRPWIWSY